MLAIRVMPLIRVHAFHMPVVGGRGRRIFVDLRPA